MSEKEERKTAKRALTDDEKRMDRMVREELYTATFKDKKVVAALLAFMEAEDERRRLEDS